MSKIPEQLVQVQKRIHAATVAAGRPDDAVRLLAVSKTKPAQAVREAFQSGQHCFGENYLQEALDKQAQLQGLAIEWHFIGPIQSNKTRAIAENFDWVHSVDRVKIAVRLSEQRPEHLPSLNICLQVNLDHEGSKSGIDLDDVDSLMAQVSSLPRLRVRGLMAIPAKRDSVVQQQAVLSQLTHKLYALQADYPSLDTLSMGMSADLEAAVAAGSTIVRIGTDIFGQRN